MDRTPAESGFRMPAEWEPHEATWIAWPHEKADWPGKFAAIPWVYVEIVRLLALSETVRLLVDSPTVRRRVRALLTQAGIDLKQVEFFLIPTDRVWTRDFGPIFVTNPAGEVALTDWQFNAWAKYPNWQRDDAVPAQLQQLLGLESWQPHVGAQRVVLEGGSIDVNGQGLMLTTEECLLDTVQARNPGLTREQLEKIFSEYLGVQRVLWLNKGITGDDTHGHVDDLARFVAPDTIVTVVEPNAADPNHEPLRENRERLRGMTGLNGRALNVVELPMPEPVFFDGQRLPASYANFYIANDRVLMPTFNDPHDGLALGILVDLFPGRKVIGIHAVDLVWGLGTLHCLTQQQPKRNPSI
jgi:agmatine deiminase